MEIENKKHGKYVTELGTWYSLHETVNSPCIGISGEKDLNGAKFGMGWVYLPEPFVMIGESHKHDDCNQLIIFLGSNLNNIVEFDAEIEFTVDGEINTITYPACVYVPKGVMHCPLIVKRVTKPVMFMDIRFWD